SFRVIRGGSWYYTAGHCRSAFRGRSSPSYRSDDLGFRVVRSSDK
ncbi:MAG: SUMF1/EgtB/PvdO family nonheme iron enzyme, partial [Halieaceae bacterium]|nr:SUMF1/EgtB/PvdO family nonheme iron enzyme [Halieaceae bacterium]